MPLRQSPIQQGKQPGLRVGLTISAASIQGYLAGTEQIDPTVDTLDAMVDVLNPYQTPDEKECWALGFKEAVHRSTDLRTKSFE